MLNKKFVLNKKSIKLIISIIFNFLTIENQYRIILHCIDAIV